MRDKAEESYWNFDARRKGYSEWKHRPQSERDAYKTEFRIMEYGKDKEIDVLKKQVEEYKELVNYLINKSYEYVMLFQGDSSE